MYYGTVTLVPLERGVPQGSILGPILFLSMIADMPKHLKRDSLRSSTRVCGYADDTTVYCKARSIQDLKEEFEIYHQEPSQKCGTEWAVFKQDSKN